MKDFLTHILTGKDNTTFDIGRVTWFIGTIAIIVLAIIEVVNTTVSLRELAEALGIVSGAGGASVMMKKETEPE